MFISTSHGALNADTVAAFRKLSDTVACAVYVVNGKYRHAVCSVADAERVTGFALPEHQGGASDDREESDEA